jgi:hypothetical protein
MPNRCDLRLVVPPPSAPLRARSLTREEILKHIDHLQVLALRRPRFVHGLLRATAARAEQALQEIP